MPLLCDLLELPHYQLLFMADDIARPQTIQLLHKQFEILHRVGLYDEGSSKLIHF
jgi:hypothetical protein